MANFNKPELTSTYTNFITELKDRDNTVSSLFSDGTTHTGTYPVRAVRWNATNSYFERRNAANNAFERLEGNTGTHKFVNLESGNITATSALSGASVTASGQVQGARFNATGTTKPANGFYLPAANEVRFTTDSQDRLTIESTGEIGIGTVDPAYTLDINGTFRIQNGTGDSYLEVGNGGSGNRSAYIDLVGDATYTDYAFRIIRGNSGANSSTSLIHRGTGSFILEANEAADMKFITSDNVRMTIHDGGSVSIGTYFTPNDKLHIKEATNNAVYLRVENNDGYARFGTDANDSFIDADVQNFRNRAGSATYLISTSGLFDIKTAAKVNGNLEVTGTINATINGITSQANDINIDEANGNTNYQVTFSTLNNTGYNRQYIDTDNSHLVYNPGTATLSGLNISCTNLTATGTVSVTASNSLLLGGVGVSASGNRWGVFTPVGADGTLEIGRYLDFHTSDGSTADNAGRIDCDGSNFIFTRSVVPSGSLNLGSSSAPWQNLYINDLNMSNKGKQNDVDGTWGDYTIQEGHEDLYLINHRTNKKFKFALIPVA